MATRENRLAKRLRTIVIAVCVGTLAACSATFQNHGYVPPDEDLQDIVVGVDTRATVDDVIGPPSTAGLRGGGDYYYVRSRFRTFGPTRPQVIKREVLAISFNEDDTVANIERFDLEDGNVVALSRRVTDSSVQGKGFLRQMLGNIGNINPGQIFGN